MSDTAEPIVDDAGDERGLAADHPANQTRPLLVAPAVTNEFNRVRPELVRVGCWRLEDARFEFDSSIIKPEAMKEFRKLAKLCTDHPDAPISLFGHADPVGNDAYNKELSGRRAEAVYAMLTRNTAMWEKLYSSKIQGVGDAWQYKAIQVMLKALGHDPGPATGFLNAQTINAVKSFQRANDLEDDGDPGPLTRGKLFPQYMEKICQEPSGKPFKLEKSDFLGKGAGPDLKADLQGCSEFNPVLMFSNAEKQAFDNPARKQDRDAENGPNRRIMALLFHPDTKVNLSEWPCPTTKEGTAKCEKRFWSDAAKRREFQIKRRTFEKDQDTFACRFYHRLMTGSPCEGVNPVPPPPPPPLDTVVPVIIIVTVLEGPDTAADASKVSATPTVQPDKKVVVVKRPYTSPTRQTVLLKTKTDFDGTGKFERSSDRVRFFRKGAAEEIKFDGKDNLFQGADLTIGVEVFAEGVKASDAIDDITLTLTLSGGSKKPGPPATAKMTSVEIKLDISEPRASAADPPVLATPAAAPAKGAASADKFFGGRPVPLQTDKNFDERAMLIVRPVKPAAFKGKLILKSENDKVKLFEKESFEKDEKPLPASHAIDAESIKDPGLKLFAEGAQESASARDTGFRLGIEGITDDGDRVSMTVCHCEIVSNKEPKDLKVLVQVPEKPERKTKSKFLPAPLIVGLEFDIELRHFIEIAKPSAFKWSTPSDKVNLTDTDKQILKLKPKKLSGALDDVDLDLLLTTDIGKLKKKHKLTCVRVEMNSVISGDRLKHTDDINIIRNPSGCVILTGADAGDEKKVPKYEITKIEPNLAWTDDDDRIAWWIIGGEGAGIGKYDGKGDFRNDETAKRGTKIQVFGTKRGDILIQPYSGGFGYGMFRANVVMPRQLKYRVSRIFRKANPAATPPIVGRNPTASHADAKLHIKVINIYLRQAGIEMVPDDSAEMASSAGNTKVGLPALDSKIVAVTKDSDGHFDVEVNDEALTFGGTANDVRSAMRMNTRNEVISLAYVTSDATGSLAAARGYPANHAPQARADPPRAYTKASFTIKDKGVPSSSLISKTGIPPDVPVDEVKMVVLKQHALLSWEGSSPATRNVNLLWGASVPTAAIDATGTGGDSTILAYANTIAHEICHVLGMGHRGVAGDTFEDGLTKPADENLMHPSKPPPRAQNLDIIQVKAIRFSEVVFRFP